MGGDTPGGAANPTGMPQGAPTSSTGIDPQLMRQMMALQFMSSAAGNLGNISAFQRRGQPVRQTPQASPLSNILPMLQMSALADKQAKDKAQAAAYYGPEDVRAGGAGTWNNPDTKMPAYTGMISKADPKMQPLLGAMDADKGTGVLATIMAQQMKPETYGAPIGAIGPDGKPVLIQPGNLGGAKTLDGFSPSPKSMSDGMPSNVQEWEYYNKLPPDQKEQYLTMKRAAQWQNLGGSVALPSAVNPSAPPQAVIPKTLPPQDTPQVKRAQAAAAVAGTADAQRAERIPVTPAQKAVDENFGKDYAETVASGGLADAEKNLAQLQNVKDQLDAVASGKSKDVLSGPWVGLMPDSAKAFVNPKSLNAQQQVEEVVQRNLRLILGAQFTQNEGFALIKRAYNPSLDEKTNADRLGRLMTAMSSALDAKKAAAKYFEDNGTLAGYKGVYRFSLGDIERAADIGNSMAPKASAGAPASNLPDPLGIR